MLPGHFVIEHASQKLLDSELPPFNGLSFTGGKPVFLFQNRELEPGEELDDHGLDVHEFAPSWVYGILLVGGANLDDIHRIVSERRLSLFCTLNIDLNRAILSVQKWKETLLHSS